MLECKYLKCLLSTINSKAEDGTINFQRVTRFTFFFITLISIFFLSEVVVVHGLIAVKIRIVIDFTDVSARSNFQFILGEAW